MGDHGEDTCLTIILAEFLFECVHILLVFLGQGFVIVLGWIHLVIRQGVGYINEVVPPLWLENRVAVISVVIQQGLDVSLVMIRVRLWTDECSIESDADLFEEGVRYVVDQEGFVCVQGIGPIAFLELPIDFEVTAREIDVIFLRINLKIDGVDLCGKRLNGNHTITPNADIRGGNPEQVQHGVFHPR